MLWHSCIFAVCPYVILKRQSDQPVTTDARVYAIIPVVQARASRSKDHTFPVVAKYDAPFTVSSPSRRLPDQRPQRARSLRTQKQNQPTTRPSTSSTATNTSSFSIANGGTWSSGPRFAAKQRRRQFRPDHFRHPPNSTSNQHLRLTHPGHLLSEFSSRGLNRVK